MTFKQLRYFLGVVDAGSFTKAAESLHVAQPAIGVQIGHLEDELRIRLLVRHSRGVRPTKAGAFLAEQAVEILSDVERVRRAILAMRHRRPRLINQIASQPWIPNASRPPEF